MLQTGTVHGATVSDELEERLRSEAQRAGAEAVDVAVGTWMLRWELGGRQGS